MSERAASLELPRYLQPTEVAIELPHAIEGAHQELALKARGDSNGCFGYFPALTGSEGILSDLPACKAFVAITPEIALGGMTSVFNFIRLSNQQQGGEPVYHLDTDAATALTGDTSTLDRRLVRRVLLNLSPRFSRTVVYLDINPEAVELETQGSYVKASNPEDCEEHVVSVIIPPRLGATIHGFDFYSNRVLHSGRDDEAGHFVAGYGYEIDLRANAGARPCGEAL